MRRSRVRARAGAAATLLLTTNEEIRGIAAVWMADLRPRVPLLLTGRAIYHLVLTNRRVLVFDTPPRRRPTMESDLLLDRRLADLRLARPPRRFPLYQLRILRGTEREVVVEFRRRDRDVGHAMARAIGAASTRTSVPGGDEAAAP